MHAAAAVGLGVNEAKLLSLLDLARWARRLRSVAVVAGTAPPAADEGSDELDGPTRHRTLSFLRHCAACAAPLPGSKAARRLAGGARGSGEAPPPLCPVKGRPCSFLRKAVACCGEWRLLGVQAPAGSNAAAEAADLSPELALLRVGSSAGWSAASTAVRVEWESFRHVVKAAVSLSLSTLRSHEAGLLAAVRLKRAEAARKAAAAAAAAAAGQAQSCSAAQSAEERGGEALRWEPRTRSKRPRDHHELTSPDAAEARSLDAQSEAKRLATSIALDGMELQGWERQVARLRTAIVSDASGAGAGQDPRGAAFAGTALAAVLAGQVVAMAAPAGTPPFWHPGIVD